MLKDYQWAINKIKLERALKIYPENEQKCKEYYIRLGGLVSESSSKIVENNLTILSEDIQEALPEAKIEPITQEELKGDISQTVSQFQCKECEFIGKSDKSLALHFRKKHNAK